MVLVELQDAEVEPGIRKRRVHLHRMMQVGPQTFTARIVEGRGTAYLGGQVSLNPVPHIRRELFGTVVVPLLSYFLYGASGLRWMIGWASAPYDPFWEDRHPRRAAIMAAAGPLANLALALIGFIVLKAGLEAGIWQPYISDYYELDHLVAAIGGEGGLLDGLGRFCSVLLSLNLLLFLFNLIPLPPMDGAPYQFGVTESIELAPASYMFVVLPQAGSDACQCK